MARRAPMRDVVQVHELEGERGGKLLVCVLSCGCFATRRAKRPPQRMPCVACFVVEASGGDVASSTYRPGAIDVARWLLARPDSPPDLIDIARATVEAYERGHYREVLPLSPSAIGSRKNPRTWVPEKIFAHSPKVKSGG